MIFSSQFINEHSTLITLAIYSQLFVRINYMVKHGIYTYVVRGGMGGCTVMAETSNVLRLHKGNQSALDNRNIISRQ